MSKEKTLDDIARVAGGAVSVASGLAKQVRDDIRSRVEDAAHDMDLVVREDFERLEAVLQNTNEKLAALEERLNALETKNK